MSTVGVFVCLVLVLTAVSTAPSHQRAKRQEPPLPQGFPQHLKQFHASHQGSADPTTTKNSQNPPQYIPAGANPDQTLNIPAHDEDHVKVSQIKNEIAYSEGSLELSVSTQQTNTASTEVNPSPDQKTVKDSATLQLEKLIEDHRLANMKHRERQLQQLEAAKAQLEKQIENQKQMQKKWLEDKMIENKTISEAVEDEYTNTNNSYTDKDSVMVSKANQNNDVEIIDEVYRSTDNILTNESEENPKEEQGAKLLLAGLVSDNNSLGHEEVFKKEQKNPKLFELAMDNGEDGSEETSGTRFGDYTTEIGLQFENIIQEETSFFDKEEQEIRNKASNKLDIPKEVTDAVDLVSRYFQQKNSNNLSAPEYVWRAVQELSNYLN